MVRVLVVDDSGVIRALIRGAIEWHVRGKGVEIVDASDGEQALHAIETTQVDLVLLDWAMPKIDGLALVRRLRASGNEVPVVMVTANANDANRDAALSAGVTAYVLKPFRITELYAIVEPYIEKARAKKR